MSWFRKLFGGIVTGDHSDEVIKIDDLVAQEACFERCTFVYKGGDFIMANCYLEDITIRCRSMAHLERFLEIMNANCTAGGCYWAVDGENFDRSARSYKYEFQPIREKSFGSPATLER